MLITFIGAFYILKYSVLIIMRWIETRPSADQPHLPLSCLGFQQELLPWAKGQASWFLSPNWLWFPLCLFQAAVLTLPKGPTLIKPLWNLLSSVARWPMQLHADCWFTFRLHTHVNVQLLMSCLYSSKIGCKSKHTSHSSNGWILLFFFFSLDLF